MIESTIFVSLMVTLDKISGFRRHETYLKLFELPGFNVYKLGKETVKI